LSFCIDQKATYTSGSFMRISKKAEYAVRALVVMARNPRSWQIQELSAEENIPVKFLEQILLTLRRAGLLSSKRGVGGGYLLRQPASRISVGDVITLLDGPIAPVPCAARPPMETCTCPDPGTCPVRLLMTQVRQQIEAALNEQSIDDLAQLSPDAATLAYEI
jgi:Rrf2 family protein